MNEKVSIQIPLIYKIYLFVVAVMSCFSLVLAFIGFKTRNGSYQPVYCIDTPSVVEAQKFLWLKELKNANHSTEALTKFTKASQAFPQKLQEAISSVALMHGQTTLYECRVLAYKGQNTDLTDELFKKLGIDGKAAMDAMTSLRADTFGEALGRKK